jgi:hypothetical protein
MSFKEYLKNELEKPVSSFYSPDGNSARAVVVRGLCGEVIWQYKAYPARLTEALKGFDGLETPIGWFIGLPVMVILSPVLPITGAYNWHRKSIGEYKKSYERSK